LGKASAYFQEKITTGIGKYVDGLEVETDNKEIGRKARKLCQLLQEETAIKLAAVQCCAAGFSSSQYLRAISAAELETGPKKERKKESKITTTYSEADIDHPELFQTLREWRAVKAKENNVPHFHILHQKTLIQIVVNLPDTLDELMKVKGIGKKLSERYGEELVTMISEYRQKYAIVDVILPTPSGDLPDKPTTPREPEEPGTDTKRLSLELFLQGLTPEQIASQRNLVISTIEGHLAHFVARGELAIDRLLSSAKLRTIEEKLQQMPDKKLSEIKLALGSDYSYGEIKFVQAHLQHQAADTSPPTS
jgi:ribonuclease D